MKNLYVQIKRTVSGKNHFLSGTVLFYIVIILFMLLCSRKESISNKALTESSSFTYEETMAGMEKIALETE